MSARMRDARLRRSRHRRVGGAGAAGGAQCRRAGRRRASARCSTFRRRTRRTISSTSSTCCTISARSTSSGARSRELFRVLKPGGLLFVHEINTRNMLFRFYMGYVFPSLNCIDEGVERWLLPHRLAQYTDAPRRRRPLLHVSAGLRAAGRSCGLLAPIERLLERSPLARVLGALHGGARKEPRPELMTADDRPPIGWRDARSSLARARSGRGRASGCCRPPFTSCKWPASGPVRLALLAPAWQLLARAAAALCRGACRQRSCGIGGPGAAGHARSSCASLAAPFSMLWLWVVPYLPWLPDRLPLLLVLAGSDPLGRLLVAAMRRSPCSSATIARDAARGAARRRSAARCSRSASPSTWAWACTRREPMGLGGDEPHYLIITESLLRDGDLQIENNHQRGDYRSFYPRELRPDFLQRGQERRRSTRSMRRDCRR